MEKKVTLRHVAKETGLSIQTVSNVIHQKGKLFSEETRRKVLDAVRVMGYRPNYSAQTMRRGRYGNITLITSSIPNQGAFSQSTLHGILDFLENKGIHLSFARLPDEKLSDSNYMVTIMRDYMTDGLLINYIQNIPERFIKVITDLNLPSVWINSKQKTDCVYLDEYNAGKKAVQSLINRGHKNIVFINLVDNVTNGHYSISERLRGFNAVMNKNKLTVRTLGGKHFKYSDCERMLKDLLTAKNRPTAVITMTQETANLLLWLANSLDIKVPDDLSIVSFSGKSSPGVHVPYTRFCGPFYEMGQKAAELILNKIDNPKTKLKSELLKLVLVEEQSVYNIQ